VVFAALGTLAILKLVDVTIGARADVPEESAGLDLSQHGEEAYSVGLGSFAGTGGSLGRQRGRPPICRGAGHRGGPGRLMRAF